MLEWQLVLVARPVPWATKGEVRIVGSRTWSVDESGQGASEYAMLLVLIVLGGAWAITSSDFFEAVGGVGTAIAAWLVTLV